MSKLSLAGAWKLRGEFMDVTAERYNEVLRKMDAAPVRATLPAFLKLEDLSEEEQAEFLKDPNPHFHVMTDKANHAFPSKYAAPVLSLYTRPANPRLTACSTHRTEAACLSGRAYRFTRA